MIRGVFFMLKKIKIFSVIILVSFLYCGILGMLFNNVSTVPVFSSQASDTIDLPIVMYHSVLKDTSSSGKYVITPAELENDIKYLKNHGYSFVSGSDVISYTYNNTPLPEKPVMLTFDDGFYNNYSYVLPLLKKYDAKAVISIVGQYTDEYSESNIQNVSYSYLRWSDIYDLFLSHRTDVGNHSYNFHSNTHGRNGAKRNKNEDLEQYKTLFYNDTAKTQKTCLSKTGFAPEIYTYPFGSYSAETTDILKEMGFKMSLICEEGINHISHDPNSLFLLKRYNRPSGIYSSDFFCKWEQK